MKLSIFSKDRGGPPVTTHLVVGLGNPGDEYADTKHNAGFMAAKKLAAKQSLGKSRHRYGGRWREGEIDGCRVAVLMPLTFMNRSGDAVVQAANRKHISPADIIVIHDDMDFPFGTVRAKKGGGSGGHRGLESIIRKLETDEFSRVRIGVGRPEDPGEDPRDWVLAPFNRPTEELEPVIGAAADCAAMIVVEGIDATMRRFNTAT